MPTIVACTQWKFFLSSLIREKWLFCRLAGSGLAILLVLMTPVALKAQEAWLLTYGPGEEVWELFGHNAIWIRDQDRDLDHTFSFGYFDLDRPGFHRDFARGIMPYYGAATIAEREFEFYRQRDRSIRAQRLDLSVNQVNQLTGLLNEAIFSDTPVLSLRLLPGQLFDLAAGYDQPGDRSEAWRARSKRSRPG